MEDKMTGLRKKYLDAIREIDVEVLESVLPSPSYSNFYPLMKGILSELSDEIKLWQETAASCTSEIDIKDCDEEVKRIEEKLKICEAVYRRNLVIEANPAEDSKEENNTSYNLVFGINPAGNISFKKDLERDIDYHYYEQIVALLESLENGTNLGNVEKRKRLGSNSEKLRGLLEVKGFQLRIIYRELPNNILYIEMIRVKKDDWSSKDRKDLEIRDSLLSKDFERIKKRIKNNDNVEQLIIDNQQVLADLKTHVENNTIGRKKNNG